MVLAPINKFICEMRAMIIHKEELEAAILLRE